MKNFFFKKILFKTTEAKTPEFENAICELNCAAT